MATTAAAAEPTSQDRAPPPGTAHTIPADISSLESLLTTLDRARQALPALLRSFSSSTTSGSVEALSRAYRTSSLEAVDALRTLGDQLTVLDPILVRAQQSQIEDAQGILVKARMAGTQQQQQQAGDDALWVQLNVLAQHQRHQHQQQQQQLGKGTASFSSQRLSRRSHQHEPATFAPPRDRQELQAVLQGWKVRHADKVLECEIVELGSEATSIDPATETTEIKFVLQAVLKAYVSIHWESSTKSGGEEGTITTPQVERVACFGLNETKSSYLASQFVLFQNLTRTAMELIEATRSTLTEPVSGSQSDLEQVLTFLTDPPLPF